MERLKTFLAALWWGSLTTLGFEVVPLLFLHLETPAIAGQMAAKLFSAQTWVSMVCGMLFLFAEQLQWRRLGLTQIPSPWVLTGVLLAALLEFTVVPHIVARDNLALWHNLGSALYLCQWMCAGKLIWDRSEPTKQVALTLD
jgi:uncharacterized membrane protein YdcZ (DUF606 family)